MSHCASPSLDLLPLSGMFRLFFSFSCFISFSFPSRVSSSLSLSLYLISFILLPCPSLRIIAKWWFAPMWLAAAAFARSSDEDFPRTFNTKKERTMKRKLQSGTPSAFVTASLSRFTERRFSFSLYKPRVYSSLRLNLLCSLSFSLSWLLYYEINPRTIIANTNSYLHRSIWPKNLFRWSNERHKMKIGEDKRTAGKTKSRIRRKPNGERAVRRKEKQIAHAWNK